MTHRSPKDGKLVQTSPPVKAIEEVLNFFRTRPLPPVCFVLCVFAAGHSIASPPPGTQKKDCLISTDDLYFGDNCLYSSNLPGAIPHDYEFHQGNKFFTIVANENHFVLYTNSGRKIAKLKRGRDSYQLYEEFVQTKVANPSMESNQEAHLYAFHDSGGLLVCQGEGTVFGAMGPIFIVENNGVFSVNSFCRPHEPIFRSNLPIADGGQGLLRIAKMNEGRMAWGFSTLKGEVLIEPKFRYASRFSDGLAVVANLNGDKLVIDLTGSVVFSGGEVVEAIDDFNDGNAIVHFKSGLSGFLDVTGQLSRFDGVELTENLGSGLFVFSEGHGGKTYGIISRGGEVRLPVNYDRIIELVGTVAAIVEFEGQVGVRKLSFGRKHIPIKNESEEPGPPHVLKPPRT